MKLSKTSFKELIKKYWAVLIKFAMLDIAVLIIGVMPVFAAEEVSLIDYITGTEKGLSIGAFSLEIDKNLTSAVETGSVNGAGNPYTIYLNSKELIGSANNGITISSEKTLTIKDGDVSGFGIALINVGTLKLENITFTSNTTDVSNSGKVYLTGTNTFGSKFTGTGTAINSGTINIKASNLDLVLENRDNSYLNLGDGVINKDITGGGNIQIKGNVVANANINQHIINIASDSILTVYKDVNKGDGTNDIFNYGKLNLAGGNFKAKVSQGGENIIVDNASVNVEGSIFDNLSLGNNAEINLINNIFGAVTVTNLNIGLTGKLAIDVDDEGYDKIVIEGSASGILYLSNININNELNYLNSIELFNGGDLSNLTINQKVTFWGDFAYIFTQDETNKGTLNIEKKTVSFTLPEVIQAKTNVLDATKKINTFSLSENINLEEGLGTLNRYEGETSRTLTIDGNNYTINAKRDTLIEGEFERYSGITINSGDVLMVNNTNFKNFLSDAGGGIKNFGVVNDISGSFSENQARIAGAIYNEGIIKNITSDFSNNIGSQALGGAIYNLGEILSITGDFVANSAKVGGAIANEGKINIIAKDSKDIKFNGNYISSGNETGGAVYNASTGTVGLYAQEGRNITFVGISDAPNATDIDGIYNEGKININGDGTIAPYEGTINIQNVAGNGTINIYGGNVNANNNFVQKNLKNQGIFNFNATDKTGEITTLSGEKGSINIQAGSFVINGGIIQKTISISSGANLTIKENVSVANGITNNGDFYLAGGNLASTITGTGTTNINGNITANADITQNKLNLLSGIFHLNNGGMNVTNIDANGGSFKLFNEKIDTIFFDNLTLRKDLNLFLDVDLANEKMDTLSPDTISSNGKKMYVSGLNLISEAMQDKTQITFSSDSTLLNVTDYTGPNSYVLGKFTYTVVYEDGKFTFTKTLTPQKDVAEDVVKGVFSSINNNVNLLNKAANTTIQNRLTQLGKSSAYNSKKGQSGGDEEVKYGLWAQAIYSKVDRDRTSSSVGFKGHSEGVVIGGDAELSDNVIAGFAYAYTKSNMKSKGSKSDIDTHGFYAYGQYKKDDKFVNGSLGYGFSKADPKDGDKDIKSNFYSLDTLAGYEMNSKVGNLTPTLGLRYIRVEQKSYHEEDVKVKSKNANTLTAVAKVGWNETYKVVGKEVKPRASIGFIYDIKSDNNKVVISSAGSKTLTEDGRLKRFGTEILVGTDAKITNNWNVSLDYTGEFRQHYENHTGTLSVKYDF